MVGKKAQPPARAVAEWDDPDGTHYVWPQALVDNRRSRVLRRIERFGMSIEPGSLVVRRPDSEGR